MHDSQGMHEGKLLGGDVLRDRSVVHHESNAVVCQQQPEHILSHQLWQLASEHHVAAAQMGFDLVEGGLDRPTFRVEARQIQRRCLSRVEDIRDEPVRLAKSIDPIVDQTNQNPVAVLRRCLGEG